MNDRELLELAAKAASITYFDIDEIGVIEYGADTPSGFRHWTPLTDDGDALRLAVKLNILPGLLTVKAMTNQDDPYAATRRAIVRAAAELGKMKREKES